jgi:hypothetical protein
VERQGPTVDELMIDRGYINSTLVHHVLTQRGKQAWDEALLAAGAPGYERSEMSGMRSREAPADPRRPALTVKGSRSGRGRAGSRHWQQAAELPLESLNPPP